MEKQDFKEQILELTANEISKLAWAELSDDINAMITHLYSPEQDVEDAAMDLLAFVEDRGY